jgi:hypothetical protein
MSEFAFRLIGALLLWPRPRGWFGADERGAAHPERFGPQYPANDPCSTKDVGTNGEPRYQRSRCVSDELIAKDARARRGDQEWYGAG